MDSSSSNNSNNNPTSKSPILCTAGCGFFGSEAFNNMCSKCYKSTTNNNTTTKTSSSSSSLLPSSSSNITNTTTTTTNIEKPTISTIAAPSTSNDDDTTIIPIIEKSRKHVRSPSPDDPRTLACNSAPASSIASPSSSSTTQLNVTDISSTTSSPLAPSSSNDKPMQTNKGRCFKCRLKVPLAKQATNKCRCGYVFCDNHRYPDRHDCDIDYAKMDREILAKNNPKLHKRPRGGRSFQRIDSL